MKNIFWTGYCNTDRNIAIADIEKIVACYGYLIDFKHFSDISISIRIEMEECKIDMLFEALQNYMSINDSELLNSFSKSERVVFLNITFSNGTGLLINEIPAVPG